MRLQITLDCLDPDRLVPFWCAALGYEPTPAPDGHATWRDYYLSVGVPAEELGDGSAQDRIQDPAGERPGIWFQVVPEAKTVKNRMHLDVLIGRHLPIADRRRVVDEHVARLLELGGTVLRWQEAHADHYGVTMQDPEGNELCFT